MTFKFIFTFPEVENIEDIDMTVEMNWVSNNILNLTTPALHKPLGQEDFMGWEIEKVIGDLELIRADEILTKNNLIQFLIKSNQEYYETTIHCKMKWNPTIILDYEWEEFYTIVHLTIDTSNPNPETCCTYIGTSSSLNYNDWDKFFGHYPVLLKDGIETVRLNPNNYNEDINGNSVDIESGNAGDVMIAFPRRGLRISKDNGIISISFTNAQDDNRYQYYAHTHNKDLEKFYVGAYNGFFDDNGRLRSLSGKIPTNGKTLPECRKAAQLNGNSYEQFAFYQLVYLQAMFIAKYKNLDGQSSIGNGKAIVFG